MTNVATTIGFCWLFLTAPSYGVVIADSVAEFSGVQGQGNWYYGYWNRTNDANGIYAPSEFVLMSQYLTGPSINYGNEHAPAWFVQDGSYWTALYSDGGIPNGTNGNQGRLPVEHWSIRRWTSEVSGQIEINGQVGWATGWSGSSIDIVGRILVDGVQVFSQTVAGGDPRFDYSFPVEVNAGSYVELAIDPNGVDVSDHGYFTATITPEPGSAGLVVAIVLLSCVRMRSYPLRRNARNIG